MYTLSKYSCAFIFLLGSYNVIAQNPCKVAQFEQVDITTISEANCLIEIGQLLLQRGKAQQALSAFEKALKNRTNEEQEVTVLNQIAVTHKNLGNNSLAIDYGRQSLHKAKRLDDKLILAATYNDFGLVMSNVDDDAALDHYLESLRLYQETYQTEHINVAQSLINIGIIYRNIEFYGDAINNFELAEKMVTSLSGDNKSTLGFINYNLGQTYFEMNNTESALAYFNKALSFYKKVYGEQHPDVARTYNRLGNVVNRSGNFEEALAYYQQALIANTEEFSNPDIEINPSVNLYFSANTFLNSLYYKAQAFEDYHFNFSLDFKDLKTSLSTLHSADSLIDIIRKVTTNEQDKIAIGALAAQVYENGVRISYAMADLSFKKDEYFEHAFYFAEKSKSAVLLQTISNASAKSFANIPQQALEMENFYQNEITFYEQKLAERNPETDAEYRNKLLELRQQYEDFVSELEEKYPEYYNLKYNVSIPTIAEIQKKLDDKTALISYFLADASSRLYVFQVSAKKLRVDNVDQTENFDRYLSGFRNSIYFKEDAVFQLTGQELYDLLFPSSLPKGIQHLVIVPSGRLGTIPFEALLNSKVKDTDYKELPYLIKDYSISYQYASALYFQSEGKSSTATKALLCAPIQFITLQDLPGSGEEVKALTEIFNNQGLNSDVLIEANATKQSLKQRELSNYKYLHLATHGTVNEYSPELSRIFLRENAANPDEGSLYSGEIYNLNLNADLVTLSACETGLGQISKGEGIIGLSRALVYAGAQNIMVSLWKVADNSTSILMTDFYSSIRDSDYQKALRKAKLNMVTSEYAHPYFWAPFVLIGK